MDQLELKMSFEIVLKTLTPREYLVLRLLYGLGDQTGLTYRETAEFLDLTKAKVRGIEQKALRKLRHESRSKFLGL